MAKERVSAKRYGVRYGRKGREKVGKIEKERRDTNKCPYCHYEGKVDRLASGIYYCNKCKSKFTGRAYVIGKKVEKELVIDVSEDEIVVPHADVKEESDDEQEKLPEVSDSENFGEEIQDSEDFGEDVKA